MSQTIRIDCDDDIRESAEQVLKDAGFNIRHTTQSVADVFDDWKSGKLDTIGIVSDDETFTEIKEAVENGNKVSIQLEFINQVRYGGFDTTSTIKVMDTVSGYESVIIESDERYDSLNTLQNRMCGDDCESMWKLIVPMIFPYSVTEDMLALFRNANISIANLTRERQDMLVSSIDVFHKCVSEWKDDMYEFVVTEGHGS